MSNEVDNDRAGTDLKSLENFVVGNEDLDRLEALLDRFNIFEAIGAVRQEILRAPIHCRKCCLIVH
jgi:hypothetical protein